MSTPIPVVPTDGAIPWYRSQQFRAILTIVVTQILARLSTYAEAKYHFNITALDVNAADIVAWTMDTISSLAAYWALHARGTQKSAPQIVLTKSKADAVNASVPNVSAPSTPETPK